MKLIVITLAVVLIFIAGVQGVALPTSKGTGFSLRASKRFKWKSKKRCRRSPYLRCFLSPIGKEFKVTGTIDFSPVYRRKRCRTTINGTVRGLPKRGARYGWHVHEFGDITDTKSGLATGGHFDPAEVDHGLPDQSSDWHAGDLGNLEADRRGVALIDIQEVEDPLTAEVIGRALIIHRGPDDGSQPTGNSGARIAQCVLGRIKK